MAAPNSDTLPPEVQAEVDKIRQEEGLDEPKPEETSEPQTVHLSRRAQKEQERQEELAQARQRADQAAQEAAAARAAAAEAQAANERTARQLAELTALAQQSYQPSQQQDRDEPRDPGAWRDKYDRQVKKAKEALTAGNLDEYHERILKAAEIRAKAAVPQGMDPRQVQQMVQQHMPQQVQQKPPWVTMVENEFPDVVTHGRGLETVGVFMRLTTNEDAQNINPENLRKAFGRAREELGTKQRTEAQREQKKQMLSGGGSGGARSGGAGGKGEPAVVIRGLPKGADYREVARRAGMTPQEYARAYAQMNPQDVEKD